MKIMKLLEASPIALTDEQKNKIKAFVDKLKKYGATKVKYEKEYHVVICDSYNVYFGNSTFRQHVCSCFSKEDANYIADVINKKSAAAKEPSLKDKATIKLDDRLTFDMHDFV
jgi:hypothetical protein